MQCFMLPMTHGCYLHPSIVSILAFKCVSLCLNEFLIILAGVERGCLSRRVEESTCVSYTDLVQRTGTECVCPEDRCNSGQTDKPSILIVLSLIVTLAWVILFKQN